MMMQEDSEFLVMTEMTFVPRSIIFFSILCQWRAKIGRNFFCIGTFALFDDGFNGFQCRVTRIYYLAEAVIASLPVMIFPESII